MSRPSHSIALAATAWYRVPCFILMKQETPARPATSRLVPSAHFRLPGTGGPLLPVAWVALVGWDLVSHLTTT